MCPFLQSSVLKRERINNIQEIGIKLACFCLKSIDFIEIINFVEYILFRSIPSSLCKMSYKKHDKQELPNGWVVKQSKSYQRVYYFNTLTGVSTWEVPEVLKPYLVSSFCVFIVNILLKCLGL